MFAQGSSLQGPFFQELSCPRRLVNTYFLVERNLRSVARAVSFNPPSPSSLATLPWRPGSDSGLLQTLLKRLPASLANVERDDASGN